MNTLLTARSIRNILISAAAVSAMTLPIFAIASGESLDVDFNVESPAFPCIEAAVDVLSINFHQRSIREDREYIAAILEENCVYRVTVQAGSPGKDEVSMKIRLKECQTLVALWHTHGAPGPRRELYSATDSRTVRKTGLPFYLTTPHGKIKVLGQPENGFVGSRVSPGWNEGITIGSIQNIVGSS